MTPAQPIQQERIIVTVKDQSKLDFLMELFSYLDFVKARREKVPLLTTPSTPSTPSTTAEDLSSE